MEDLQSSSTARVKLLRERYGKAGMKRIEVWVPAERVDEVRAYAADLREEAQSDLRLQVRGMLGKAYAEFRASCLDNIFIDPESASFGDAQVVAAALMHRGNAEAYKLGKAIKALIR